MISARSDETQYPQHRNGYGNVFINQSGMTNLNEPRENFLLASAVCQPVAGRLALDYLENGDGRLTFLRRLYDALPPSISRRFATPLQGGAALMLALVELRTPNVCTHCNGKGEYYDERYVCRTCTVCEGVGVLRHQDARRAELVGTTLKHWQAHWAEPYAVLERYLCDVIAQARVHRKQLLT